jgi:hypothetical protein
MLNDVLFVLYTFLLEILFIFWVLWKSKKNVILKNIFIDIFTFFYIISTYTTYNKLRDSTSERERNFLFTSDCFNKHNSAVAEKNAGPCLCPI